MIETPSTKADLSYDFLKDAILRGELKAGSHLVIGELTRQMGVSQIPIREALRRLHAEGFVDFEPHLGAIVTDVYPELLHEIFDLQEALEVIRGRVACQRLSCADMNDVEEALHRMDACADDPEQWEERNKRLEQVMCEKAGTRLVANQLLNVLNHWERLRRFYSLHITLDRINAAQKEHWQMMRALRARDSAQMEQLTREHVQAACAEYSSQMDEPSSWRPEAVD